MSPMTNALRCPLCGGQVVKAPDALTVEAGGVSQTVDLSEERCGSCGADELDMAMEAAAQAIRSAPPGAVPAR
jgi:hypothetical protein